MGSTFVHHVGVIQGKVYLTIYTVQVHKVYYVVFPRNLFLDEIKHLEVLLLGLKEDGDDVQNSFIKTIEENEISVLDDDGIVLYKMVMDDQVRVFVTVITNTTAI